MKHDYDEETLRHQFDSFIRKVLRGESANYRKELSRRSKKQKLFSDMSEKELDKLCYIDKYPSDYYNFDIMEVRIEIADPLIGAALQQLPDKKRNIILLAYFIGMSDSKIAKKLKLAKATIYFHRTAALKKLKELLQEINDEG